MTPTTLVTPFSWANVYSQERNGVYANKRLELAPTTRLISGRTVLLRRSRSRKFNRAVFEKPYAFARVSPSMCIQSKWVLRLFLDHRS